MHGVGLFKRIIEKNPCLFVNEIAGSWTVTLLKRDFDTEVFL